MPQTKATVLLVDDEQELLEIMETALQNEGYATLSANDGQRALELLQTVGVDIIVADVAMPRMNGYQLYERVRANPDWTPIPFVMLTGRAMDSDIRYAREMGVDDYLTKPVELDDLLSTVRGRLLRAKQLSEAQERKQSAPNPQDTLRTVGSLTLDRSSYQVHYKACALTLSAREFSLLEYFMRSPGAVLDVVALVKVTHDLTTDPIEAGSLLRPLIRSLRGKIQGAGGNPQTIENIRGVGYRLLALE